MHSIPSVICIKVEGKEHVHAYCGRYGKGLSCVHFNQADVNESLNLFKREKLKIKVTSALDNVDALMLRHCSYAPLPLCSFAEDEIICYYGGVSVRDGGRTKRKDFPSK